MTTDAGNKDFDWTPHLTRLADAKAVTLVGANESGGATRLLLNSLEDPDCRFDGRLNLVNRSGKSVFDHGTLPSVDRIDGDPGLTWLLVPAAQVMPTLRGFSTLPQGVVVYAAGYREAGNETAERELRAWAIENRVPVFGPQSVGVAWFERGLNALDIAIKYTVRSGDTAVLAQSGGMLSALLAAFLRKRIGLHSAFAMGNEAVIDVCDVGLAVLADPGCRFLAIYMESVRSIAAFARLAEDACARGKPLVVLKGGRTELGSDLAGSHTGALATPARLLESVAEQFGAVLVSSVEQMISSLSALSVGRELVKGNGSLGVFSNYGGGNVVVTDALHERGVRLAALSPATRQELFGQRQDIIGNPYDASGGLMGRPDEFSRRVDAFVREPNFDIVVHVLAQLPDMTHAAHMFRYQEFVRTCRKHGKLPFTAVLIDESGEEQREQLEGILGFGLDDAVTRLKALQCWTAAQSLRPGRRPRPAAMAFLAAGTTRVATSLEAREILRDVPLAWPGEALVGQSDDPQHGLSGLRFPLVAKAEAGLAHRASQGAVITHIPDLAAAADVLSFFRRRFAGAVAFSEFVPHEEEYFIGLFRNADGSVVMAIGPGGHLSEKQTSFRILPLTGPQIEAWVAAVVPSLVGRADLAAALDSLQSVAIRFDVEAVDLNPVVLGPDGRLTVLDGKIHLRDPVGSPSYRE